jgi:hypothetical protein
MSTTRNHPTEFWRVRFLDEPYEAEYFDNAEAAQTMARLRAERAGRESDIEHVVEVVRVRLQQTVEVRVADRPPNLKREP